jgi:hypothetical protein
MGSKLTIKSVKKPEKNKHKSDKKEKSKDKDKKNKIKDKDKDKKDKKEKKTKSKTKSDEYISKSIQKIRKNQSEIEEILLELSKTNVQTTINMCEGTKTTALKVDAMFEDKKSYHLIYEFKKTVKF